MADMVTIGDCTLYHGDCRDVLPTLGKVDACVTDPPYDGRTHEGARSQPADFYKTKNRKKPDYQDEKDRIIDFSCMENNAFAQMCTELCSITLRWVVMTCAWQQAAHIEIAGVPLIRLGVWVKPNGAPQFTGDRPGTGWEAVAILHRPGKKRWNGGGHHAVWTCPIEQGGHPTQKPLRLIKEWVSAFSDPGETILDPFMGSGTTGVACAHLGRKFVGIERERKYFDIACKRIEEAYAQPRLCLDEPVRAPAEQIALL